MPRTPVATASRLTRSLAAAVACVSFAVPAAAEDTWSPRANVELIVPTAAGSTMDMLARTIQDIWQKRSLVAKPVIVQTKPGAGGALAWTFVSRRTGDGHLLAISGPTLFSQEILGTGDLSYRDVTPIAQLFTEWTGFAVAADSPIVDGRALVAALKTSAPPTVGVAPGFAGSNHVALLKLARAVGVKSADVPTIPFKGANESVTALVGKHIDVAVGTVAVLAPMAEEGKIRLIAIAAPQRIEGRFAAVPTWRELGHDVVEGNWRGVVGPKNLGAAEVRYWQNRLSAVVKTEDWQKVLQKNFWSADFRLGDEARRFLDQQFVDQRAALATAGHTP